MTLYRICAWPPQCTAYIADYRLAHTKKGTDLFSLQSSQPTMLFSNDMIDLKGQRRTSVRQMAVLAKTTGPLSDLLLYGAWDRHSASQGSVLQR